MTCDFCGASAKKVPICDNHLPWMKQKIWDWNQNHKSYEGNFMTSQSALLETKKRQQAARQGLLKLSPGMSSNLND